MAISKPAIEPQVTTSTGLKFVLATIVLLLSVNTVSSIYALGWKSAIATTSFVLLLDVLYVAKTRDRALLGWIVFGLAAGVAELVADAWLVRTGTLIYPTDEPMLWDSPAYMPIAWAIVLVQIGYLSTWLCERMPRLKAAVATALLAGVNIPIYEHLADGAGWWHYVETPMLLSAPYYVIVAEFMLALPLAFWAASIVRGKLSRAALLGIAEGGVMLAAVVIAFRLVGPCSGALLQLPCP